MDKDITRYLNDHLAGSCAAIPLIREIGHSHHAPEAREFFLQLGEAVVADQSTLESLLTRIGHDPSTLHKMAGGIASRLVNIKLMWEQVEPGKLGLFEALEMLTIGVQGKCLLWRSLIEIAAWFPEWKGIDFENLELQATRQRDDIEFWRLQAAASVLLDEERWIGIELV